MKTKTHPKAKLSVAQVRKIKTQFIKNDDLRKALATGKITPKQFKSRYIPVAELARRNGVTHATLNSIKAGATWKHVIVKK